MSLTYCVWVYDLLLGVDVDLPSLVLAGLDGEEEKVQLGVAQLGNLGKTVRCKKKQCAFFSPESLSIIIKFATRHNLQ